MSQQDQSSKASLSLRNCQLRFVSGELCLILDAKLPASLISLQKKKKKLYTWCSVDLVSSPEVSCCNPYHFYALVSCLVSLFICHIILLLPQRQCPGLPLSTSKNAASTARAFELTSQLQNLLVFVALGSCLAILGVMSLLSVLALWDWCGIK